MSTLSLDESYFSQYWDLICYRNTNSIIDGIFSIRWLRKEHIHNNAKSQDNVISNLSKKKKEKRKVL